MLGPIVTTERLGDGRTVITVSDSSSHQVVIVTPQQLDALRQALDLLTCRRPRWWRRNA